MEITEDRKKRVIDLYFNQHKTYAEIAQIERISPRDMHAIIKEEQARLQKYEQQELSAEAYKLFSEGKKCVQVSIILNLREPELSKFHKEYWKLRGQDILNLIYKETNGKIWPFLKLYKELIKKRGMSIEQIVNAVEIAIYKLPYMESLYEQVKEQVERMQHIRQGLANDIEARKHKISILDRIAFSSELECKRTEQRVQELTAQKERIERLIANISNGEGYSKLMQIVKENVKVVLSEKRVLISISFAAVIQTLKDNPQTVKLFQNISTTNDGQQHKDNDISITQCFESNKDRILDLAERNYENLVQALTNNAIDNAGASSSSNPILSLPQSSSSTFPGPSNKIATYRIEEPEDYHDDKGDIAD